MPKTFLYYYGTHSMHFPPQKDKITIVAFVQNYAKPTNTSAEKLVGLVIPSVTLVKSLYK